MTDAGSGMASTGADVRVEVMRVHPCERYIRAAIFIPTPVDPIWQVLTDYEGLVDFLPHLVVSRRLPHPTGGIRVEQVGAHSWLKVSFRARVVLDIEEHYPERLDFHAVAGDFVTFRGAWELQSQPPQGTLLHYSVYLRPRAGLPVRPMEGKIRQGVVVNLQALRQRAETLWRLQSPPESPA